MNDSETRSRRHGVGRTHAIKEKGRQRLSCMAEQNRSQTLAQLTAQYNAGPSRIVSDHTIQRTLLDTGLRSKHPTQSEAQKNVHRSQRQKGKQKVHLNVKEFMPACINLIPSHDKYKSKYCSQQHHSIREKWTGFFSLKSLDGYWTHILSTTRNPEPIATIYLRHPGIIGRYGNNVKPKRNPCNLSSSKSSVYKKSDNTSRNKFVETTSLQEVVSKNDEKRAGHNS
ncbi:UNVERIFIED_CONTAM: hypothetical protein NCL1_23150 [Trichonephila clavipes]